MRSNRNAFISLAQPKFTYPDYLPSGFLWVYIYLVSPLNNVINNLDYSPTYLPVNTVLPLFPSFIRS